MNTLSARTVEFLKQLPYFRALQGKSLQRVLSDATEIKASRGTLILRREERCLFVYIVTNGRIKVSLETKHGEARVIELLGSGSRVGDDLVLIAEPSLCTVEALIDSGLVCIRHGTILREIDRNRIFARHVMESLSRRVYERTRDIESYTLRDGKERLIEYLLSEEPGQKVNGVRHVTLPESKGLIASKLNLTKEHFSRILRGLSAQELIHVNGAHIVIANAEKLRGQLG